MASFKFHQKKALKFIFGTPLGLKAFIRHILLSHLSSPADGPKILCTIHTKLFFSPVFLLSTKFLLRLKVRTFDQVHFDKTFSSFRQSFMNFYPKLRISQIQISQTHQKSCFPKCKKFCLYF